MNAILSSLVGGLALGSVYAILALGFTLVFGVANLINFAQGSLFMVGAYVSWTGITTFHLPLVPAVLIAIIAVTLLGIVIDLTALRPLEKGPAIAPFLSTLAVSIILDRAAELVWTPQTQSFPSPLSSHVLRFSGTYLSLVDVAILALGVAAMVALSIFLRRTWTGRAVRATAQDSDAALQVGVPVSSLRTLVFGLSGMLGAIGGVLAGMYFENIFPQMGLPFGLKGFIAAVLGGIESVPGAIAGGLVLGIAESATGTFVGLGYRDLVSYALLLIVLLVRPQGILGTRKLAALGGIQAASGAVPSTSPMASTSFAAIPRAFQLAWWQLLAALAVLALLPVVAGTYLVQVATTGMIFGLLAVSLSILSGTAGRISLGHAAFWGVGAYTTALLARYAGMPLEVTALASGLLAALAALLSSLPLAKLSGFGVLLGTLAIGEIFRLIFLTWVPVTRGPLGIFAIPAPRLAPGFSLGLNGRYWLSLVFLAFGMWVMTRLVRSMTGTAWRALREDVVAGRAAGIPMVRSFTTAFAVSGFLAGIAGCEWAYAITVVYPDSFQVASSFQLLTMVVLGGLGNPTGAVLGGIVLGVAPELFRGLQDYRMIVYGIVLLLMVRFKPDGLAGSI